MRFNERLRLAFYAVLISAMIVFSFACGGTSGNGGNGGNGGEPTTYSILGQITTNGTGLSGVTMSLSGASTGTTTTDSNGNYSFTGLSNGSYTVIPFLIDCPFEPSSRDVTISGASETAVDFVAGVGAEKNISPVGGTVEVANPLSPLYGIKVEVPPDALDTDSTILIETTTVSPSYNTDSRASSPIFELESPDVSYFNIPVTVTVPYDESLVDDERYVGLFIYNPSTDSWQSTATYEIDTINNTISAATMHFSIFQIISLLSGLIEVDVDTGFSPYLNGFDIQNTGDWCFGMSAYSKWFFDNRKPNILYGFYDDITAENVAKEAHLEITTFGGGATLGLFIDLTKVSFFPYCKLHTALVSTGKPQVLGMVDFSSISSSHAVVAYKIQDEKVYIYDSNHPGVAPILIPNNFGSFEAYENYKNFILLNYSVVFTDFEDIYDKYFPDEPSFLGIEWVPVPAGSFEMGDNFNEGDSDELSVHTVYLDTYSISKYEVTFEQYDAFCDATGWYKPYDGDWDGQWGRGDRPVINVNWRDANAFCDWLSDETGENIHLPTEAQWEKAARGTDQRRFPWGNGPPDSTLANYDFNEGKTRPVGSYPAGASFYGVHDMAGNVMEWCSDWYSYYYDSSPTNNPQGPASGIFRVIRDGGWYHVAKWIRSATRTGLLPSYNYDRCGDFGFRVCKD